MLGSCFVTDALDGAMQGSAQAGRASHLGAPAMQQPPRAGGYDMTYCDAEWYDVMWSDMMGCDGTECDEMRYSALAVAPCG